jgi:1-acyl-sn-glycerol-3-phosphate acyltransferase
MSDMHATAANTADPLIAIARSTACDLHHGQVLPKRCRFIAKRELASTLAIGRLLRRLNTVFVDRMDARAGLADAKRLVELAARGECCLFFPEGTFTRAPGLMPFHLGAFHVAVQSGKPVLPIALKGTRVLLRDEQWLPRRVPVAVHAGKLLYPPPAKDDFAAAVELRDAAQLVIRDHCGEPPLQASP